VIARDSRPLPSHACLVRQSNRTIHSLLRVLQPFLTIQSTAGGNYGDESRPD
jgi:hypothetical protein